MRMRPRRGDFILGGGCSAETFLDLLDMLADRDQLPPDPNEKPLTFFDENGNWMPDIIAKERGIPSLISTSEED